MAVLPLLGFCSEGNVTLLLHTFLYLGLTFESCGRVCGGSSWLLVDAGESSPPWAWVYENITNQEPESQQAPFFCDFCFEFCPDIPQWWAVTRKPKPVNHSLYNVLLLIVFLTATKWNQNRMFPNNQWINWSSRSIVGFLWGCLKLFLSNYTRSGLG